MYGKVKTYINIYIPIQEFFIYGEGSQCWKNKSNDLY